MKIDLNKIKKELKRRGFFSFTPLEKYPKYPVTSRKTKIVSWRKQRSILLPSFLTGLVEKIEKVEPRAEIYLVGGAVRDLMMNRKTTDFDFIVRNVPAKKLENILAKLGKVNFVGKTFGVFKLAIKDNPNGIDIALPRTDHAFGTGGRKDFKVKYDPKLKIEDDLSRRDFTINAISLQITNHLQIYKLRIIDTYNGLKDLQKKIIRTVGKPEERFKEDYSRMLRAIRIACELGFKIETKTWLAIKKYIKHLNDRRHQDRIVPYEVLAKEILKALNANALMAFDLFDQAKIFKVLMPEIEKMKNCPQPEKFHSEGDVFTHTRHALKYLFSKNFLKEYGQEKPSLLLILATLFHDIGKPPTLKTPESHGVDRIRFNNHDMAGAQLTEKIVERLKLTSPAEIGVDLKKLLWLIRSHMFLIHVQGKMDEVRVGTLEKHFFHPEMPNQDLLKLFFVDILASRPANGKPFLRDYYALKKRIKELAKIGKKDKLLPPPILNGCEIMKILKLESSPLVGKIKEKIREAQLEKKIINKKEAVALIKKIYV